MLSLFCREDINRPLIHAGVLVLSEFAGAAQSLGAGAILVNPWNITDMAAAIEDALTMSDQVLQHKQLALHAIMNYSAWMCEGHPKKQSL